MTRQRDDLRIDPEATVNDLLLQYPAAVAAFNALGIDACCGGDASLEDAAERDGANIDALLAALDAIITRAETVR
jgi:regulator of cell morphogenesis and NO signaling